MMAGLIVVAVLIVGGWIYAALHHKELVLIGVVDANDVVVTPRVQARLDSLFVEEGSEVKAGQMIA